MAGCAILIFLPMLVGLTAALVIVYAALWVYTVYAVVVLLLSIVGYAICAKKGLFIRYAEGNDWKHYATVVFKWFLRFEIAFYAITGLIAIGIHLYLFLR